MRLFYHGYTTKLQPRVLATTSFEEKQETGNLTSYMNFIHSVFLSLP